ncbi:MAG: MerR family transcriptional regulator [bacterium]|nr:MerR family transcriptional regulator [bacterium]
MNDKKKTYTISELAAELDISPSTIRFYEEKGLILPDRSPGNQRIYTAKNRARLKLILRGKRFGSTLDQVAEMIGLAKSGMAESDQIEKSLSYIEKKFIELKKSKEEILLFEKDLSSLKRKLLKRKKEIGE